MGAKIEITTICILLFHKFFCFWDLELLIIFFIKRIVGTYKAIYGYLKRFTKLDSG